MSFDYGESPIKSITSDGDGYTVYVGTGNGDLACFDMRSGEQLNIDTVGQISHNIQ
jgi:hypothetical protein